MHGLILLITVLIAGIVGFMLGFAFGVAGILLSMPAGFLIGLIGAVIANEVA